MRPQALLPSAFSVILPRRRLYVAVAVSLLILVGADQLGFFSGIDTYLYDLSFRIRGSRAVSERIIIAAVDEKSLQQLGRWPLPRRHYADLLHRVDPSAVVGFDLIMAEPTSDDPLLAEAIKRHGKVILPTYLDSATRRIDPVFLSPRGVGHIHVEHGVDNVTRDIFHTMMVDGKAIPSLSSLMQATAAGNPSPPAPSVAGNTAAITLHQPHRINFYGPSGTFRRLSLIDILNGTYPPEFFRDRYLLVGLTAAGIVDEVSTPFSQNRNRMPGIEVHANALENLLDGTAIRVVGDVGRWLAVLAAVLVLSYLYRRLHEGAATILCLVAVLCTLAASFALFILGDIWFPPTLMAATAVTVYFVAYLQRLDEAARILDDKHSSLIARMNPSDDAPTPPAARGLAGYLTEGGIEAKAARLIMVEHRYETILEETVKQRTQELSSALDLLNRVSDEMIIRLTKAVESRDEGTGDHVLRVGLYARELAAYLGMPHDFVDCISFASAMHDIGKIGIPDHVLLKPDDLTDEEMAVMRTHCLIGHRVLAESPYPKLQMSAVIALNHHERWDGKGYPYGRSGEDIPLEARIFAIGDCYDALRSQRHYKPPYDHDYSCRLLMEGPPGQFDPRILEAFAAIAPSFGDIFDSHPNRNSQGFSPHPGV